MIRSAYNEVGADDMDLEVPEKKSSPELLGALEPKLLADSNVYSVSESILLRWLNFHFMRTNRERYPPRKVRLICVASRLCGGDVRCAASTPTWKTRWPGAPETS